MEDIKEKFKLIFSGLKRAYGQTKSKSKNEIGKLEGKSWIVAEPITDIQWDTHLAGKEPSLGIIPINEKNECTWGAIDIDTYDGFDHKELIKKIVGSKLPLIVCRSKSGGAHIFLFVSEPVSAKDMQVKLKEIAVFLNYGSSEIFPKQIQLNTRGTGNFLNLPYNHPEFPTRYALDDEGNALFELNKFINLYEKKVVSNLSKVIIEKKPVQKSDDFKGAPPCLINFLQNDKFIEGMRNQIMFQLGVYLRLRFPKDLEKKMDEYNLKYFSPPLPSKEIQTLFKQVENSDRYFYQCDNPDFENYCEKIKCKTKKFGVGDAGKNDIGNMKKWISDEPEWEVTHNGKVVILNKKQLKNHDLYSEECLAQADEYPEPVAKVVWVKMVNEMISKMTPDDYIRQPMEVTAKGQYFSHLQIFLENNKGAKVRQDVLAGMVYEHEKGYFIFKPEALRDFLRTKRFSKLSDSAQHKAFESFGGSIAKFKVNNKSEHCWKIPTSVLESNFNLKEKDFTEEEPY
jgi:hypothetical protein